MSPPTQTICRRYPVPAPPATVQRVRLSLPVSVPLWMEAVGWLGLATAPGQLLLDARKRRHVSAGRNRPCGVGNAVSGSEVCAAISRRVRERRIDLAGPDSRRRLQRQRQAKLLQQHPLLGLRLRVTRQDQSPAVRRRDVNLHHLNRTIPQQAAQPAVAKAAWPQQTHLGELERQGVGLIVSDDPVLGEQRHLLVLLVFRRRLACLVSCSLGGPDRTTAALKSPDSIPVSRHVYDDQAGSHRCGRRGHARQRPEQARQTRSRRNASTGL